MRRLPTLGGPFGNANYITEFGAIAGTSILPDGRLRAALWTPTVGPLLAQAADEASTIATAAPAQASAEARARVCAAMARRESAASRARAALNEACLSR